MFLDVETQDGKVSILSRHFGDVIDINLFSSTFSHLYHKTVIFFLNCVNLLHVTVGAPSLFPKGVSVFSSLELVVTLTQVYLAHVAALGVFRGLL